MSDCSKDDSGGVSDNPQKGMHKYGLLIVTTSFTIWQEQKNEIFRDIGYRFLSY